MNSSFDSVVAAKDGGYWGVQYSDGHATVYDFGPIENAQLSNNQFCKHPLHMARNGVKSDHEALEDAVLINVRRVVTYEIV